MWGHYLAVAPAGKDSRKAKALCREVRQYPSSPIRYLQGPAHQGPGPRNPWLTPAARGAEASPAAAKAGAGPCKGPGCRVHGSTVTLCYWLLPQPVGLQAGVEGAELQGLRKGQELQSRAGPAQPFPLLLHRVQPAPLLSPQPVPSD